MIEKDTPQLDVYDVLELAAAEPRPVLNPCAECRDPGLCGTEGECAGAFTPEAPAPWDRVAE